jgi:hypothetical protein
MNLSKLTIEYGSVVNKLESHYLGSFCTGINHLIINFIVLWNIPAVTMRELTDETMRF